MHYHAVWFSSPFSGTSFQFVTLKTCIETHGVSFRPLSRGLLFNLCIVLLLLVFVTGFRPLSRGLLFNDGIACHDRLNSWCNVFVPFLGDFFSIANFIRWTKQWMRFRPLSRGLLFNKGGRKNHESAESFRPLSRGLLFNMSMKVDIERAQKESFRPLSRGLLFNEVILMMDTLGSFSSPFSGTSFQ